MIAIGKKKNALFKFTKKKYLFGNMGNYAQSGPKLHNVISHGPLSGFFEILP